MKLEVLEEFMKTIPVTEKDSFMLRRMKKRLSTPTGVGGKAYKALIRSSPNEKAVNEKRKKAESLAKSNPEAAKKLYMEIADKDLEKLKKECANLPDADDQDKKWVKTRIGNGFNLGIGKDCVRKLAIQETNNRQRFFRNKAKTIK